MGDLPTELHDAMERLLDADAESARSPAPLSNVARIERLRTSRAVIAVLLRLVAVIQERAWSVAHLQR